MITNRCREQSVLFDSTGATGRQLGDVVLSLGPLLGAACIPLPASKPAPWTLVDQHYQQPRLDMQPLFQELGIAA
jgi:hypothetical protein